MKDKQTLNYKYIALGILLGYLSPYVIALIKSYLSPSPQETSPNQKNKETTNPYGN